MRFRCPECGKEFVSYQVTKGLPWVPCVPDKRFPCPGCGSLQPPEPAQDGGGQ